MAKFEHIQIDKAAKRRQLGIPEDAFLLLSVGELNKNKNHQIIVKALAKLNHPHIHYAIAGVGNQQKPLQKLANKLNVAEKLHILGYRDDVQELNYSADVFCFPSKREGLSVSLMEAMACGLPVLCSQTRGNTDLINRSGGELFNADNVEECCAALAALTERNLSLLSKRNQNEVKKYSVHNVLDLMNTIYDRG